MALGTILGAAVGGLASAGASFGLNKLFGGGGSPTAPLKDFKPSGINAGGLSTSMVGDNLTVSPSAARMGLVGNVSDAFGRLRTDLGMLRSKVAPGISELRSARLAEIDDARRRSIGDLRENLQRRRVLGSSFGQDAITRAEAEFSGQRERVAAETFLQELEATNNIITQEFNASRMQFQTFLDELNLQAEVATGLAGKATDIMGKNAQFLAQLNAAEAAGSGKFFGQLMQPVGGAVGKAVSKWFNPSSGPTFSGDGSQSSMGGGAGGGVFA